MYQKLKNKVLVGAALALNSALVLAQTSDDGLDSIAALTAKAPAYIAAAFGLATISVAGFWALGMYKKVAGRGK